MSFAKIGIKKLLVKFRFEYFRINDEFFLVYLYALLFSVNDLPALYGRDGVSLGWLCGFDCGSLGVVTAFGGEPDAWLVVACLRKQLLEDHFRFFRFGVLLLRGNDGHYDGDGKHQYRYEYLHGLKKFLFADCCYKLLEVERLEVGAVLEISCFECLCRRL